MRMNLLGMFPFTAPYLPWVLLLLSAVLGSPLETDLVRPFRLSPTRTCLLLEAIAAVLSCGSPQSCPDIMVLSYLRSSGRVTLLRCK